MPSKQSATKKRPARAGVKPAPKGLAAAPKKATKSAAKVATPKAVLKPAPTKPPISKKSAAPKVAGRTRDGRRSYNRGGLWRLLAALSSGELRRVDIGRQGDLSETTLHNNLARAIEEKWVFQNPATHAYHLTPEGRKKYLDYVKSSGHPLSPPTVPTSRSGPARVRVPDGSSLPAPITEALRQIASPHSIARLSEKVVLLNELATKMPSAIGSVLLEICEDLQRVG